MKKLSLATAIALVIANMIGTGVFTSLGFQVKEVPSVFALLALWALGGIVALCGALCYGELASLFPRSGGEYNFLSRIYHPSLGFAAGWVSSTVGFAAPVAAASMALGRYGASVLGMSPTFETVLALAAVGILTAIHAFDVSWGGAFQRYATALELLLITIFVAAGFFLAPYRPETRIIPSGSDAALILTPGFFIALAFVSFSYSGWNAAAYIAGEMESPGRNVPRALFLGVITVAAAYLLLNTVFLRTASLEEIRGRVEVGHVAAGNIFGAAGGDIMGGMIALLLVATVSSMIFAGPRVLQVMGEDSVLLRKLGGTTRRGAPAPAVLFQSALSIILILTASFEAVVKYVAFTLDVFACLAVIGVFIMRFRSPREAREYRARGYPVTPLLFLVPTVWTLAVLLRHNTVGSVLGLATIGSGFLIYGIDRLMRRKGPDPGTPSS